MAGTDGNEAHAMPTPPSGAKPLTKRPTPLSKNANASSKAVGKNPFNLFDNSRKKLTNVEAQRVMSVLDETLKKAEIVAFVSKMATNVDRLASSRFLTHELIEAIKDHAKKEAKYKSHEPRVPRDEVEWAEITQQLRHSTRSVCRLFLANPTAFAEAKSIVAGGSPACEGFLETFAELKGVVYERLLTTVEEERERQSYMAMIAAREKKSTEDVEKLQADLFDAKQEGNREITKRKDTIRKLKEDIQEIKSHTAELNKRMDKESRSKEASEQKIFHEKEESLLESIAQLKAQLEATTRNNRESELSLRKRKAKIETEVENWITKYDQDMGEKQDELEDIQTIYDDEKHQLSELDQRFCELEVEYVSIVEERRIDQMKKEEAERQMAMLVKAATLIQAVWRGFKCRKELKRRKGKKGKGKGSGKKK
eukprot:Opistho-2@41983